MPEPPGPDLDAPSAARVHDYWLGGLDNYQPDRDRAALIEGICPAAPELARASRAFTARAVTWAAGQGIAQFIDLGCGWPVAAEHHAGSVLRDYPCLPAAYRADDDVHVMARAVNPDARVAYVDNDWLISGHASVLLGPPWAEGVAVAEADLRDPAAVLSAPRLLGVIDLAEPVCIILGMVLHYLPAARARQAAAGYAAAVAPGSCLAVSTIRADDAALWPRLRDAWPGPLRNHTRGQVRSMLAGLEVVPPGIAPAAHLRPGWASMPARPPGPAYALAGIGRKPGA